MDHTTRIEHALSVALRERPIRLPLRANFDKPAADAFADNKQIARVQADNWQILFGRRGTGKTTLLANYAHFLTHSSPRIDEASIELVANDFMAQIDEDPPPGDHAIAQTYFADFVSRIAEHFWRVWSQRDSQSKFYRRFLSADQRRQKRIEDLVIELKESVETARPVVFDQKNERSRTTRQKAKRSHNEAAGADVKLKLSRNGVGANAGLELAAGHKNENVQETVVEDRRKAKSFKYDYYKTRAILDELLQLLGIKKLYIFIDEWSELDRSASREIQPFFADLLKRVFGNSPQFVFKLGAVRKQTRLNYTDEKKGIVGLELGADIFEIDLDQVYTNGEIDRSAFFEDLLFRHLAYCDARIRAFARTSEAGEVLGRKYLRPIDTFITHIFKDRSDFEMLINGAGGLPRDFIEMFDALAKRKDYSVERRWSRPDVQDSIRSHYTSNKLPNIDGSKDFVAAGLYERIIGVVTSTRSRTLLIPRHGDRSLRSVVGEFYHKRLLHDVRTDEIPAIVRARYDVYNVDLGLVFDVFHSELQGSYRDDDRCHLPDVNSVKQLEIYVIDKLAH